jgi:hypothetical protein
LPKRPSAVLLEVRASALTVLRPRFFLAGQDLFPFEITPIRDNLEILAVRRGLCLLRHARELAAVIADIGNLVGDNEVLLATLPDLAGTWLQLCCCRGTVYVPVRLLAGAMPPQARLALLGSRLIKSTRQRPRRDRLKPQN